MMKNTDIDKNIQIFSDRLELKLESFGWTQREFANRLKINESRVSNWIQGRNGPQGKMRAKVAALLQVDSRWLLGEDTEYTDADMLMVEEAQGGYSNNSNSNKHPDGQSARSSTNLKRIEDFMAPWRIAATKSPDIASHILIQLKLHLPHKDLEILKQDLEND